MKPKAFLVFLLSILMLGLVTTVAATDLNIDVHEVYFDGVEIKTSGSVVAGVSGETVPVRVWFTANEGAEEVEVSAWIQGDRRNKAEREFVDLIDGKDYNARLSLRLPSDLDEIDEELTLYVRVESDKGSWEESYTINIQRESYSLEVLFVEIDNNIRAGSTVPVDVVVSNIGRHELEDTIVSLRIPGLGVEKRAYFGDLTPIDNWNGDEDDEDTVERRIFLSIPSNAQAGVYTLEIEALNDDASSSITKNIAITGSEQGSDVLTAVTGKEVAKNGVVSYDLIIVNSGNRIAAYTIVPETTSNLVVSVDQPLITIPAGSSKTVKVNVQAGEVMGTHTFAVNVESNGQLVKRVSLSANVVSRTAGAGIASSNIVVLTVVLAIIFLVLLVVLIVLLSRKPEKSEEFEESYY